MTDLEKLLERHIWIADVFGEEQLLYTADQVKAAYELGLNADKWVSVEKDVLKRTLEEIYYKTSACKSGKLELINEINILTLNALNPPNQLTDGK